MLIPDNARMAFQDLLIDAGLELTVDEDYAELRPDRLRGYDLIVSAAGGMLFRYRGGPSVREANDQEVDALLDAVEAGTPFIGLHCASLMFMDQYGYRQPVGHLVADPDPADLLGAFQVRYLEMLGNVRLEWPDDPRPNRLMSPARLRYLDMIGLAFTTDEGLEPIRVSIADRDHVITSGVDDFDIDDELYHMVGDRSRIHTLIEAKGWPLAWTRRWGRAKIHYNALGHDNKGVTNPAYQRLVIQGIRWALEADERSEIEPSGPALGSGGAPR